MGVKEFFSGLFSETKEEKVAGLSIELYERTRQVNSLSKEVETLKDIIKALENRSGYYVGLDENGLESNHIYADRIGFYDDKYVFCLNTKIVGLLSSEIYKEVVFVENEKEKLGND